MRPKMIFIALTVVVLVLIGALVAMNITPTPSEPDPSPAPLAQPTPAPSSFKSGGLYGRVISSAGEAIPGAKVRAGEREATTDERGEFAFEGLPAGELALDAQASGWVSPGPVEARGRVVTLQGPKAPALTGIELILRRPGKITGKILAAGEPVEGAQVGLYYLFAEGLAGQRLEPFVLDSLAQSGPDGSFTLAGIAPGRLRVLAQAPGYAQAMSRELNLMPEGDEQITLDLAPSGAISFEVINTQGQPLQGAEVILQGAALAQSMRLVTDMRGQAQYDSLPEGKLSFSVSLKGHRRVAEIITLTSGQALTKRITLEDAAGLFGRVIFPQEMERGQQANVTIWQGDKVIRSLYVPQTGEFSWPQAPEGAYRVQATSPFFAESQKLDVRTGQEFELTLGPAGQISGRVVNAQGQPVQSYELVVDDVRPSSEQRRFGRGAYQGMINQKINSPTGSFELGPLAPGTYFLRVRPEQGLADVTSGAIVVDRGQQVRGVVLKALGGGQVYGKVVDRATNKPLAGASVEVFEPLSSLQKKSVVTDDQGNYTLTGVSPGRLSLRVNMSGYGTEMAAGIELRDGGRVERVVRMIADEPGVRLSFYGIGAELRQTDRGVIIQRTMEGMPAETFGLKNGDLILGVDGEDAQSFHINELIERIRGEEGVAVSIEIEREGEGRMTLDVERGRVKVR